VDVVALERVVHDAELSTLAGHAQRLLELADEGARPERWNVATQLEGDVGRTPPRVRIPPDAMNDTAQLARPTRTWSRSTAASPAAVVVEAELSACPHGSID
jgi:hypothetical protein